MPKYLILPKIGMNMEEAVISEWLVQPGDRVEKEQMVVRAETDKAVQDLFATESGIVRKLLVKPGDVVPCQQRIAVLTEEGEDCDPDGGEEPAAAPSPAAEKPAAAASIAPAPAAREKGRIRISPLARKMARELGIAPEALTPAQPGKRIVKADVLRFRQRPAAAGEAGVFVPLSRRRQVIAKRMAASAGEKPRVTLSATVDCGELIGWRERLKQERKVTYNELLVKACACALGRYPEMNCVSEPGGHRVMPSVNIGVAVDTPEGLLVPVLKETQRKGVLRLAEEFAQLVEKARNGSLTLDEMTGGTFSISNLGMLGVERFDPIINAPECLILGVGCMKEIPVVVDHQVCIRTCMQLSLAFDHTAFDGAAAARLLAEIKRMLECPVLMLS